jgi:hypothetical protein
MRRKKKQKNALLINLAFFSCIDMIISFFFICLFLIFEAGMILPCMEFFFYAQFILIILAQ